MMPSPRAGFLSSSYLIHSRFQLSWLFPPPGNIFSPGFHDIMPPFLALDPLLFSSLYGPEIDGSVPLLHSGGSLQRLLFGPFSHEILI